MRYVASVAIVGLVLGCGDPDLVPPDGPGHWILVDLIHTRLQNPVEHRLAPGVYSYQGVHGFSRLFDHLEQNGYPWRPIYNGPLTPEVLDDFEVLFVNLLSEDFPDFTPDEVRAVQAFVANGGGLVAIADHTNVYGHAERLNRITEPMGIVAMYHSALDFGAASVSGSGWIAIDRLDAHPINEDIETISFQTGGGFEPEAGIAFLSDAGFADFWNRDGGTGRYGNWVHDGDDSREPRGRNVAVVAAATYGEGRVVVVGDQNIYGDVWLPFADNFPHALNAFEWAARAEDEPAPLRDRPTDLTELALDVRLSNYRAGRPADGDYYGFFHHLNREPTAMTRGVTRLAPDAEALILPPIASDPTPEDIAAIQTWFEAGRRVVVLMDAARPHLPTLALLTALAPDFSFSADGTVVDVRTPDAWSTWQTLEPARRPPAYIESPRPVSSDPACARFKSGIQFLTPIGQVLPDNDEAAMYRVRSEWGQPLYRGDDFDLARVAPVQAGELVVFLQDGLFTNRTLGRKESDPPPVAGLPAVAMVSTLVDFLETPVSCFR